MGFLKDMNLFKREEHLELPKSSYVALVREFDRKLESIQKELSSMKLLLFEMSKGEYNPFSEGATEKLAETKSNSPEILDLIRQEESRQLRQEDIFDADEQ